jgi:multiple sugar transport system permease protein
MALSTSENQVQQTGRRPFWNRRHSDNLQGWLFILPAVLGFFLFQFGPVVVSLILSFTKYNIINPPTYVGLDNYKELFTDDELFRISVSATLKYSFLSIPLSLITAYAAAILLNRDVRGVSIYRTLWYLPALVPSVATAAVWGWLLNRNFGPINYPLRELGLTTPGWLVDANWIIPSLVLINLWSFGSPMLIFLAGLQGVPQHLYDAVSVDGGNAWHRFRDVTLPQTSSIVFFNLIMGIIGTFQTFSIVYVLFTPTAGETNAGPGNAGLLYVLYLYRNAFLYFRSGYASAMAWVLFLVILLLTALAFWSQRKWVYYEADARGGR